MPLTAIIVCSPVKNNSHLAESTAAGRGKGRRAPAREQSKSPRTGYLGAVGLPGNLLLALFSAAFNVMGGASFCFSLTASTRHVGIYYRQGSRNTSAPLELTNVIKRAGLVEIKPMGYIRNLAQCMKEVHCPDNSVL